MPKAETTSHSKRSCTTRLLEFGVAFRTCSWSQASCGPHPKESAGLATTTPTAHFEGWSFRSVLQALKLLPESSKGLTLLGRVLAQQPEGQPKAIRHFERAMRLDPLSLEPVLALADL